MFDFAIIGAGAAGAILALKLRSLGKSVKLYDRDGVFAGASRAAGAFFSPKLGKDYPLDRLINSSLLNSIEFFSKDVPECLEKNGVLMLPKKSKGGWDKLKEYEEYIELPFCKKDSAWILKQRQEGYFFASGAILDVFALKDVVEKRVEFEQKDVVSLDEIEAKNIVLTTGVESKLLPRYIDITPVYGHRLECVSDRVCEFNINGDISISCSRSSGSSGSFAIGATHHRSLEEYKRDGGKSLVDRAKTLLNFDFEVVDVLGGARATSVDHFPIVGRVVDMDSAKRVDSRYLQAKKWSSAKLTYKSHHYVLNGLGARGFVYAPLCADILIEHILKGSPIPREMDSDRLFFRYFRKG